MTTMIERFHFTRWNGDIQDLDGTERDAWTKWSREGNETFAYFTDAEGNLMGVAEDYDAAMAVRNR